MSPRYRRNEVVYIPASLTVDGLTASHALIKKTVRHQADGGRSIIVDDGDDDTLKVSTRRVLPGNLGFVLVRIGDFHTETTLLDPLAKSVLQYLRLMLPDNLVTSLHVRTLKELQQWWEFNSAAKTHCVLIGHGEPAGIKFIDRDMPFSGEEIGAMLTEASGAKRSPKTFLSLSCRTGLTQFARGLSAAPVCKEFIGPVTSIHGASASQYMQTLLAHHLLDGMEILPSHRRANKSTCKGTSFRFFRSGAWIPDKSQH